MIERESGLSRYVKIIMNSQFPATEMMNPVKFIEYLKVRGLTLTIENLEYYDRIGAVRPILRLKTPKSNSDVDVPSYSNSNIFALQYYYSKGLIELPHDGDYKPWSSYVTEVENTWLFYHPYQILQIDQILPALNHALHASKINIEVESSENTDSLQDIMLKEIESMKELVIQRWILCIGLLILLDEFYGPSVKTRVPLNVYDTSTLVERITKNTEWRKSFSLNHILLLSGMKVDKIEQYYESLSFRADYIDPLAKWFMLQQLVKLSHRYKLKNQALLAQEYYAFMFMIASFIYDLTGKKISDPDDIHDGEKGKWKERIFGKPFDYTTKKTQNQILKYFLIDRPYELVFLVEGETEETVLELILQARDVDLEKDGFFVYNIQGQDNLVHLKPLFRISHLIDITIFAMLDNDKDVDKKIDRMKEHASNLGYTKEILIRKWDRDFETENFGMDAVLEKVNEILEKKGYTRVNKSEVENRMNSTDEALIRAVENTASRTNLEKLDGGKVSDIISKPYLAKQLIANRLREMQIKDDPDWNAKLPIEIELKKAFTLIPRYL